MSETEAIDELDLDAGLIARLLDHSEGARAELLGLNPVSLVNRVCLDVACADSVLLMFAALASSSAITREVRIGAPTFECVTMGAR